MFSSVANDDLVIGPIPSSSYQSLCSRHAPVPRLLEYQPLQAHRLILGGNQEMPDTGGTVLLVPDSHGMRATVSF